ncbi:N-6 DNA methylase [Patescibacteria group bacterium]|nr:N-6 DNA methylase [Patescibacteria group bacterium]MBU1845070.1 N-6 DNA methylase [Patescibacteria group bacterium]
MENTVKNYIQSISSKFSYEETSEMGYRTDFEILLKEIFKSIKVTRFDHDARARQGNKPDFVVVNNSVPILYIETKDIGKSLDKVEKSEQMTRYFGYANLVLTDYTEFRFYRNGINYGEPIKIADYDIKDRTITPNPKNYEYLAKTLLDFTKSHKEPIRSGKHLSRIMGGKAQRIRDNTRHFFSNGSKKDTDLVKLFETFKKLLLHDLTPDSFADMYAQTLVYGLFVARYHDKTLGNFSRQEARELIPNSNPLLRHFFDHIVGADFDKRLKYIVDELCEVFSHADVAKLMEEYFKEDSQNGQKGPDPVIHFYEDFLKKYDPDLRKKMGAYYTPQPIVQFIVCSIDYLLKKEFGLSTGLADTSKTTDNIHRVQILDPAVGTGTFISAVIRTIYKRLLKKGQKGRWPAYVHNDLLPRLHGFEIMMAPYTIAHLKLGIDFRKTGFWDFHRRLGIYLTNSLEESSIQQQDLFAFGLAESIAEESKEASVIKNKTPIMVVIGNPPYSVSSSNVNAYTKKLIEVYKRGLNLRNTQPLSDDYIKFIRLAEVLINKNKSGIVAYISNRSFLEGIIHKSMRASLLGSFDDIYIVDLNGDATINQTRDNPDNDQNVFDIKQGVAISIFVKKVNSVTEKKLNYFSVRGSRLSKFDFLSSTKLSDIDFSELQPNSEFNFFVEKDLTNDEYVKFISLDEIFNVHSSAIATSDDNNLVSFTKRDEYKIPFSYRPFDQRYINYDLKKVKGNRYNRLVKFLINEEFSELFENISLACSKNITTESFSSVLASKSLIERKFCDYSRGPHVFPLYIYNGKESRISNVNNNFTANVSRIVGDVYPEDIFDYIYAVLYSPSYREEYREFLKIDFPRIPYPKNKEGFKKLVSLGNELRALHLLESSKLNQFITTYSIDGSNIVEETNYQNGNVRINENQYFGNVPEIAWNFHIGGYRPAQKWLKDRKGRKLINKDLEHYQKIIVVLVETVKIMEEIDKFYNLVISSSKSQ